MPTRLENYFTDEALQLTSAVKVRPPLLDVIVTVGLVGLVLLIPFMAEVSVLKRFRRLNAHKQLPILRAALLRHQQALLGD